MDRSTTTDVRRIVTDRKGLDALVAALSAEYDAVIGPRVSGGAVTYERIASTADLPVGMVEEQEGGHYRLHDGAGDALFAWATPCSPTRSGRRAGRNISTRRARPCGGARATAAASPSSRLQHPPSASPSSACAPAN